MNSEDYKALSARTKKRDTNKLHYDGIDQHESDMQPNTMRASQLKPANDQSVPVVAYMSPIAKTCLHLQVWTRFYFVEVVGPYSQTGPSGATLTRDSNRPHVYSEPCLSITKDVQIDGLLGLDGLCIDVLSCYVFASRQASQC